ncbi:MAG: C/D box methylation guide ribonucleoprotein complex aNOP56 subunit [Candidatus Bathyarchaeota archaeon]|nr:C/D box methylation guide ribonucleoprotein complex aNOP56 subunit [Candidatus Bathyarchaeum sp.]
MKATIVESVMGAFGFGEDNTLVEKVFFPKDAIETAERLKKIEDGTLIDEISSLIDNLKRKGYTQFVFENQQTATIVADQMKMDVSVEPSSEAGTFFRENLAKIALDSGFVEKPELLRVHLHKVSIELAKMKVKKTVEKRDMLVAQAVLSVDDLDKSLNLFMSRIREWYGLHFPELDRLLEKHETYSRLVVNLGRKENFTAESLEQEGLPKNKSKMIAEVAAASMGADVIEEDLAQIQYMCNDVLNLYKLRQNLENYVEAVMDEVAPNTKAVAGALLGGRLIALAGGLMNLAKLPASTMQVLGAEKALFRSLKTKSLPPKHGIIFQHPLIHDAKRWQRGKIARALAGKITIAARVDAFKGNFAGDDLNADLNKRVQEIIERYPNAPPTPAPTKRQFKGKQSSRKPKRRNKRGRNR